MMFDARAVANEILILGWQKGYEFTQLDIQKIVYFLNGHHLREHGEALVKSDFVAWQFGPVQTSIYDSFSKYGDQPISELATSFDPIRRERKTIERITHNSACETITKYLGRYAEIPAHELVGLTHRPGTPWSITINLAKKAANVGMVIDRMTIRENFEGLTV